jgi:UDP-4-amino-4-deoxy-L-arabinose formyltransferase/UDP-glucuronic acid dehydrogenase (UDP-4-keto-hexauronic acid decarboxylating)
VTAVVFAYHDVGVTGIRCLARSGIEIAAVYTHEDDPAENRWFGSVREVAEELSVPVFAGVNPNRAEEVERIRGLAPKAIFSFWYRRILRQPLLDVPTVAAVNLHGSLLPRYRGRAPVNWMILNGETSGGVTLHHMVLTPDAGDIVDQEPFPIGEDDTPVDVYRKLVAAEERVLLRSARAVVDGTAPRVRQLESNATTFGGRRPEDGLIDWHVSARDVRNLIRAVTDPYPGAFTYAEGEKVLVWWAESTGGPGDPAAPGTVERTAEGVLVVCGDRRRLRLTKVEIAGEKGDASAFPEVLREGVVLCEA